jgi:hypothetical protein
MSLVVALSYLSSKHVFIWTGCDLVVAPCLEKNIYIDLFIGCGSSVSLHSGFYNPPFYILLALSIGNQRKEKQGNFPPALKGFHKVAK